MIWLRYSFFDKTSSLFFFQWMSCPFVLLFFVRCIFEIHLFVSRRDGGKCWLFSWCQCHGLKIHLVHEGTAGTHLSNIPIIIISYDHLQYNILDKESEKVNVRYHWSGIHFTVHKIRPRGSFGLCRIMFGFVNLITLWAYCENALPHAACATSSPVCCSSNRFGLF